MLDIGQLAFSAALSFAAIGSACGVGVAGMAAVGAWKKCFAQNKNAPFLLIIFVAAPLTQTLYGFLLMNALKDAATADALAKVGIGMLGGIAMGFSAYFQGKVGANASDALAETGKGFGNYILTVGMVETVALFVMIFLITALG
ncbi:MAG: V-type ATP synthase subunit K [Spirochaetales bacterium]|nr:V-type ATP synthase subunit K [Spirochaetales bacterium]